MSKENTEVRKLALEEGRGSANAHCISSGGAFQIVCQVEAHSLWDIFSDSPPSDVEAIADGVREAAVDNVMQGSEAEASAKDMLYKEQILRLIASDNKEKKHVTADLNGRYKYERQEE